MEDYKKCQTCNFWYKNENPKALGMVEGSGHCRFNPPALHTDEGGRLWPMCHAETWCGKWERENNG